MALGNRVRQKRVEKGFTQEKLAEMVGTKQSTIASIEKRKNASTEYTFELAEALDVDIGWLLTGEEPKDLLKVNAYEIDAYEEVDEVTNDHALIPLYDVNLSAGDGVAGYDFVETKYRLPFRIDWLRGEGVNKKYVKMMRVQGNSMFPILGDGDKVLVDTNNQTVKNNKVYALVIGDEVFVKRLRKTYNGGLEVISDNTSDFDKIVIPPEDLKYVQIIGRVFHKLGNTGL